MCWIIGIFGFLVVALQVFRIVRRKILQQRIANYYVIGHSLIAKCYQSPCPDFTTLNNEAEAWRVQVEAFLRKKLGESYLAKFNSHPGGLIGTPGTISAPYDGLWLRITYRLIWLDRFSKDKENV